MPESPSAEKRLALVLAGIAAVAILGVLAILPYRLYQRDIRHATVEAHRISSVVHASISHQLLAGEDVTDLINRFQGLADVEIHLAKLSEGEVHPAATSGRGTSSLDDTDLTYVSPPILDHQGQAWLATMHFDLSPMKRESVHLIVDLLVAVVCGAAVFSAAVFFLVRRALVEPLRRVTRAIIKFTSGDADARMPEFETRELAELAAALEKARGLTR